MKNESLHISLSHSEGKFFKQNHSIICVLGGGFFSAVNKNIDSEAQATANRKKYTSMHYQIPAKAANIHHLAELLLWVYIVYTSNYVFRNLLK